MNVKHHQKINLQRVVIYGCATAIIVIAAYMLMPWVQSVMSNAAGVMSDETDRRITAINQTTYLVEHEDKSMASRPIAGEVFSRVKIVTDAPDETSMRESCKDGSLLSERVCTVHITKATANRIWPTGAPS